VPPEAPQPRTDTPSDEEPMQVSVRVVVSAGAKTGGVETIFCFDGA